mgnify:CR=1 FL=1
MPISPVSHRSRIDDHSNEQAPVEQRRAPSHPQPSPATSRRIDADLVAFVNASTAKPAPRPNDRVLYVGMNDPSVRAEIGALRATGASVTTVVRQDGTTVRLDDVDHDLSTKSGCRAFADALAAKHGMSEKAAKEIAAALASLGPGARDELARIAMVLAPGESGASIPSRIVLSGHSTGHELFNASESLTFRAVVALAHAMPRAASQVEDIHLSGCFTAGQVLDKDVWKGAFPNLKTMWGYSKFAPAAPVGHLQAWEARTRGRAAHDPARGTPGVATWSERSGIREPGVTLEGLKQAAAEADRRFSAHFSGEIRVSTPHDRGAEDDYAAYRRLASHPNLSKEERATYEQKAEILLRVRFYESSIRGELDKAHGPELARAFRAVGLPPVDFAKLSRREALEAIDRFERRLATMPTRTPDLDRAAAVLHGVRMLDPKVIPQGWVH